MSDWINPPLEGVAQAIHEWLAAEFQYLDVIDCASFDVAYTALSWPNIKVFYHDTHISILYCPGANSRSYSYDYSDPALFELLGTQMRRWIIDAAATKNHLTQHARTMIANERLRIADLDSHVPVTNESLQPIL